MSCLTKRSRRLWALISRQPRCASQEAAKNFASAIRRRFRNRQGPSMPDRENVLPHGELDEPVSALEALELPASADFFERVQRKVWRHETVTEFVIFSL